MTEGTTVTDQLFIEIDREIEPTVIVELQNSESYTVFLIRTCGSSWAEARGKMTCNPYVLVA